MAAREHISQNELIEQAVEQELSLRGARLAEDLTAAAERLSQLSDSGYRHLVDASIDAFVAGESLTEPIAAYALHDPPLSGGAGDDRVDDPLGVLAFDIKRP